MPDNIILSTTPYIMGTGNPATAYETPSTTPGSFSPYAPGDLGKIFPWGQLLYRKVILDSGANTAADGQLVYWKNKATFTVSNKAADCLLNSVAASNRNNVAGLLRGVIPAGSHCFVLVRGNAVRVLEAGSGAGGMLLIANTGTNMDTLGVAIGTAPGCQVLGAVVTNTASSACTANFDVLFY